LGTAYWDKKKQHSKQRSKYFGIVLDKELGIFQEIKRRRRYDEGKIIKKERKSYSDTKEKEIVSFGSGFLAKELIDKDDVGKILATLLPDKKIETLKSLLSYRLINGSAMYLANDWYEVDISKYLFPLSLMSSQSISLFLRELGDEKLQKDFFKKYLPIATKDSKEGLIIDGSSMPNDIRTAIN
jgi:predicted DNA-binding transcriptional regulator